MAGEEDPDRSTRPSASYPPQPHQVLTADHGFTPNFLSTEEAKHFPGRATPHLWNMLKHPPEEFAEPRNPYPGTDPIMDARREGAKPGELSYEQVAALRDVSEMPVFERHARDAREFPVSPPETLTQAQKQRWTALRTELFGTSTDKKDGSQDQDPYKIRPRGELRKLKELANLAGGRQE